MQAGEGASYQRLEFLGDRVLGLVIAELVFERYLNADEGELSRRLTRMVRKETCAEVAGSLRLGDHLIMADGEAKSGGRRKRAILGDVCEAVIAAIYLDGGLDPARRFIAKNWQPFFERTDVPLRDAKSALQEWAHKRGRETPAYDLVSRSGPDHRPIFRVRVSVPREKPFEADGKTKRDAEQSAAERMLVSLGVWDG